MERRLGVGATIVVGLWSAVGCGGDGGEAAKSHLDADSCVALEGLETALASGGTPDEVRISINEAIAEVEEAVFFGEDSEVLDQGNPEGIMVAHAAVIASMHAEMVVGTPYYDEKRDEAVQELDTTMEEWCPPTAEEATE